MWVNPHPLLLVTCLIGCSRLNIKKQIKMKREASLFGSAVAPFFHFEFLGSNTPSQWQLELESNMGPFHEINTSSQSSIGNFYNQFSNFISKLHLGIEIEN